MGILEMHAPKVHALATLLEEHGYGVRVLRDQTDLRIALRQNSIALLTLLVSEPSIPWCLSLLNDLRGSNEQIGIIVIATDRLESFVLKAFEYGCDDFVLDGVGQRELLFRIEAVLKRTGVTKTCLSCADLMVMPAKKEIYAHYQRIDAGSNSYKLLYEFVRNCNIVLTREYLAEQVWGNSQIDLKSINTAISRINTNLHPICERHVIRPIRGVGYIMPSQ